MEDNVNNTMEEEDIEEEESFIHNSNKNTHLSGKGVRDLFTTYGWFIGHVQEVNTGNQQ